MTDRPRLQAPDVIAFDCYRTLLQNNPSDWEVMFDAIVDAQQLGIRGGELWTRWKAHEVKFRATRLSRGPAGAPAFKTYRTAWSECFEAAFAETDTRGVGDASNAAQRCIDHMARRLAFHETIGALQLLAGKVRLAVLSNADDDFLLPAIARLPVKFEAVISSEACQTYKPDLAVFNALGTRTGAASDRIWYVGDHLNEDVRGSTAAGMTSIWVNRPGGETYYAGQVGVAGDAPKPHAEVADLLGVASLFQVSTR